jgi:hypothetical protein
LEILGTPRPANRAAAGNGEDLADEAVRAPRDQLLEPGLNRPAARLEPLRLVERGARTRFADPDYVLAAETAGAECGVTLLSRVLRERYPFVAAR